MKFSPEFLKEAVLQLSEKEKDKLLIRLLKKDHNLVNRLYFELLDDKNVDDHRAIMEEHVLTRAKEIASYAKSLNHLKVIIRFLSGDIAEHVRVTKDKFGECLPQPFDAEYGFKIFRSLVPKNESKSR